MYRHFEQRGVSVCFFSLLLFSIHITIQLTIVIYFLPSLFCFPPMYALEFFCPYASLFLFKSIFTCKKRHTLPTDLHGFEFMSSTESTTGLPPEPEQSCSFIYFFFFFFLGLAISVPVSAQIQARTQVLSIKKKKKKKKKSSSTLHMYNT